MTASDAELSAADMYRVIAEYTYDWESWVDASGTPRWINPAVERMTGYSVAECLARSDYPLGLVCPADRALLASVLGEAARGGSANDIEFRVQQKDGALRWVAISFQAVRAADGSFLGYRTSVRDIEQRKRMEAELHVMRRRAEAATVARSELLANVSHELRSPVHCIAGFAELLSDSNLDEAQRRFVERIIGECAHMQRHVEDLLHFAAFETGGVGLERRPFDLERLLRDTVEAERARAEGRALSLAMVLDLRQSWVEGDPVRVGQVLRNLLDNALKFTDEGEVHVSARSERVGSETRIELEVRDSGVAMSAQEIERATQPFQQGESGTARRYGGVGLGLAIVKRLVSAMNGALHIESEKGRGTTMRVALALPAADPVSTSAVEPTLRSDHRGERALVVDDSAVARELLCALLSRAGYEVSAAASGSEAVTSAAAVAFDLVLLDYQMPDMDGVETAVALRRAHESHPQRKRPAIYLLTANAFARGQLAAALPAVDGILEKPLARSTLARLLSELAARRAAPIEQSEPRPAPDGLDLRVLDDLRSLRDRAGRPLIESLGARTCSELEEALAGCRQALAANGFGQLARAAHVVAGHAAVVGARELADCARELERSASAEGGPLSPLAARPLAARALAVDEVARRLEAVEQAWARAEPALRRALEDAHVRT
jgi:PAS domain S-box-containing protein